MIDVTSAIRYYCIMILLIVVSMYINRVTSKGLVDNKDFWFGWIIVSLFILVIPPLIAIWIK